MPELHRWNVLQRFRSNFSVQVLLGSVLLPSRNYLSIAAVLGRALLPEWHGHS